MNSGKTQSRKENAKKAKMKPNKSDIGAPSLSFVEILA